MPTVRFTPRAVADLREIRGYIAQDNSTAAGRWLDRMRKAADALAEQPLMGPSRPELGAAIRSFAVARYVLYYRRVKDGIEVVRVLHSARDIRRHISVPDNDS